MWPQHHAHVLSDRQRPFNHSTPRAPDRQAAPRYVASDHLGRQKVGAPDEIGDEATSGSLVNIFRRANLLDAASVEDGNAIGHGERFDLIVSDEKAGNPELALDVADLAAQFLAQLGVQIGEWLIQEQDRRFDDQCPCQRYPLLLAAGELTDAPLAVVLEANQRQGPFHALLRFDLRHAGHLQTENNIVEDVEMRKEGVVLKDDAHPAPIWRQRRDGTSRQGNGARGRRHKSGNHAQRRCFAASGGAEQGQEFSLGDVKRDAVDHCRCVVGLGQVIKCQMGRCHAHTLVLDRLEGASRR